MLFPKIHRSKAYYQELINVFDPLNLIQMVNFVTWKRLINGMWRTSIIDHVYTNDVTTISNLKPVDTLIGDHVLIIKASCHDFTALIRTIIKPALTWLIVFSI